MKSEYSDDELLMISGIQHFAFCRRQWALIHIEKQWNDNVLTVEGELLHERVHDYSISEKRKDIIVSRGMSIFSRRYGISGVCDIVEFHQDNKGVEIFGRTQKYIPIPVEYKRGKPKEGEEDILQLVAQAVCLEEMLLCTVDVGYLYYGEIKRRVAVEITQQNRDDLKKICDEMHQMYERSYTPKVKTGSKCKACSMNQICIPKLCGKLSASLYIERSLNE